MNLQEINEMGLEEFSKRMAEVEPRLDQSFGEDEETLEEQIEAFSKFEQPEESIEHWIKAVEHI